MRAGPSSQRADLAVLVALNAQKALDSTQGADLLNLPLMAGRDMWVVRPSINPSREQMLASGTCQLRAFLPEGDGSFDRRRMPAVFTGIANKRGVQLMTGAALFTAASNALSSRKVKRSMRPRWQTLLSGRVAVSTHGIYLEGDEAGLQWFPYEAITSMERVSQSVFTFTTSGPDGMKFELASEWSELMFVWWVHASFPSHPGKYAWFDEQWLQRVRGTFGVDPLQVPPQADLGVL